MTLTVPNPDEVYSSQNAIWKKFAAIFTALEGLLTYVKAFEAYYMEALQEFYLDNVQYLEIRGLLPQVSECFFHSSIFNCHIKGKFCIFTNFCFSCMN